MADNSNQLIVKVIGDTRQLSRDLAGAEKQIQGFSRRTSTIKSTGADKLLGDVRAMRTQADTLKRSLAESEAAANRAGGSFRGAGAGALIAGVAVNTLGRNLSETGGEAGRFGDALSKLSTGNFVGFYKAATDNTAALSAFASKLVASGDAAAALARANQLAAAGFGKVADAARAAALQITNASVASQDFSRIHDPASPGDIATQVSGVPSSQLRPKQRPGVSASQRNTFFDNALTRSLDRAKDGSLPSQVAKLKEIAASIQKRIDATKDVTRKLNLEDELLGVNRQRKGVEEQIAQNLADRIARENLAKQAAAAAARAASQRQQFRALGFGTDGGDVIPGVPNLRKQLASLSERVAAAPSQVPAKLRSQLAGVRKVLAGEFGKVTEESRRSVQGLFDTIRGEFDKQSSKGPLTRTSGLDTRKVLAGLGLSPAQVGELRGRLSSVNSAGLQLSGGTTGSGGFVGGRPVVVESHVTVQVDQHTIGQVVTKAQQKAKRRNPSQRRGPNRFD